ncbi:MAG: dihydrofolate reductase family protein [Acidobacteria bacterium]|nr:dihydrofolate reductase family protein [Acidobacteriota bacterium]
MRVRADLNISLDGFATTEGGTPDNPMGPDWEKITGAYVATRTFRARVFGDESGAGTTGLDNDYATRYFEGVGAEIMGAGMFGFHDAPEPAEWWGWWGDTPPFHVPVFVLTHQRSGSREMNGGTTFTFCSLAPREVLDVAREAAGGLDVRVGGGPSTVREFLADGLIDDLHVAIAPVLLGRGINLWEGLRGWGEGYRVVTEVAESGTTHVTWSRE